MPPTFTDEGTQAALATPGREPRAPHSRPLPDRRGPARARLFRETPEGFGYLLKDRVVELDDFLDAVHRVGRGGTAIDPEVVSQLLGRHAEDDPLAELTPRELEVLGLIAEGRSNKAICAKLFLSPKTIETHVNSIFLKLGLLLAPDDHRRVLAVLAYLRGTAA